MLYLVVVIVLGEKSNLRVWSASQGLFWVLVLVLFWSLWAIDDEATMEFMKVFYQELVHGRSASEALNKAMKSMREHDDFSAVRYWAPFVLIGDDVTLEFEGIN